MKIRLFLMTLMLAVVASPALAVDFGTVLLNTDGRPVVDCVELSGDRTKCEKQGELTLGLFARFALDASEQNLGLSDIVKRGNLAEKIKANPKTELSLDEAKLIRDQIVKFPYAVGVRFQAIRLVDPKAAE